MPGHSFYTVSDTKLGGGLGTSTGKTHTCVTHREFLEEFVGHKEVQSWVNGEVKCLQLHKSRAHLSRKDPGMKLQATNLHIEWLVGCKCVEILKIRF